MQHFEVSVRFPERTISPLSRAAAEAVDPGGDLSVCPHGLYVVCVYRFIHPFIQIDQLL